jgi:hypothetical protein
MSYFIRVHFTTTAFDLLTIHTLLVSYLFDTHSASDSYYWIMNSRGSSATAVATNALKNNDKNDTTRKTRQSVSSDSFLKDSMHVQQNKRSNFMPRNDDETNPASAIKEEDEMEEDEWCEETEFETESETSSKSDDEQQAQSEYNETSSVIEPPSPVTTANATRIVEPPQPARISSSKHQDQVPSYLVPSVCNKIKHNTTNKKKNKKSVSFATNTDGTIICQAFIVSIHDVDDCWYRPEEKLAMQEHFSRVVLYYQDGVDQGDDTRSSFVDALAKLQMDAHKLTMPETCQHLSTIALHTATTRGLESYVLSDEFDYMRQKHLLRILMAQNHLEQQFGMYDERQANIIENNHATAQDADDIEDLIMNELSRTSLRWSVRSTQFARLIALLDKHAAQEALSSPWK